MVLPGAAPASHSPLLVETRDEARPGPGELLLKVAACAVCRTDLQICEGDLEAKHLPIVPGHQAVGTVLEVGRGVADWKVGERAAVGWLAAACGACVACTGGNENLCERAAFTGWDRDGGFAENMTVRADFALRVPTQFSDLDAAPLLCGGVIGYHALKVSGIRPGGRLGLYGFGASARLAIQVARNWDCEVYVATRSVADRRRAEELGASWAGGYDEPSPHPLDAAVTFAPAGEVVIAALRAVARGATVAINAIHLDRIPEFPYELLWWERALRSVSNYTRDDASAFLALAAEIGMAVESEAFPLGQANDALRRLSEGSVPGAAVLVP
jgi:alcohol dehydrogenase, propanol-preferring